MRSFTGLSLTRTTGYSSSRHPKIWVNLGFGQSSWHQRQEELTLSGQEKISEPPSASMQSKQFWTKQSAKSMWPAYAGNLENSAKDK